MGETLEASVVMPGLLVLLLIFLLLGPRVWAQSDQGARRAIEAARVWIQDSRLYERRGEEQFVLQGERLAQILDWVEDAGRLIRGGTP